MTLQLRLSCSSLFVQRPCPCGWGAVMSEVCSGMGHVKQTWPKKSDEILKFSAGRSLNEITANGAVVAGPLGLG